MDTPTSLPARLQTHLSKIYNAPFAAERARNVAMCFVALELSQLPGLYDDVLTTVCYRSDRTHHTVTETDFQLCAVACVREFVGTMSTNMERAATLIGMGVPPELASPVAA